MFKDLPEGTTNWACPACKGVCSSGVEHICPADERVKLTEKGLAEIKKKRKPKTEPKMIMCHNCGSVIEDFEGREICHWCRSAYWRVPWLRDRLRAAWWGWKLGR